MITKKVKVFIGIFVGIALIFCGVISGCIPIDIDYFSLDKADKKEIIPVPTYTYYAAAPEELAVSLNVLFFCPKSIPKKDLETASLFVGDTDSISVTSHEIISALDDYKAIKDHYYVDMNITLDVTQMPSDTFQFKTLTMNLKKEGKKRFRLGKYTVDKRFADKGQEVSPEDQRFINEKPRTFYGYPDNVSDAFSYLKVYPNTSYYFIRPVSVYTVNDDIFCDFLEVDSGFTKSQSPLEQYEECYGYFKH